MKKTLRLLATIGGILALAFVSQLLLPVVGAVYVGFLVLIVFYLLWLTTKALISGDKEKLRQYFSILGVVIIFGLALRVLATPERFVAMESSLVEAVGSRLWWLVKVGSLFGAGIALIQTLVECGELKEQMEYWRTAAQGVQRTNHTT